MTRAALMAGFDAGDWAGSHLFSRNGTNVAAPAMAAMYDGGHYPDAAAFLHGWASDNDLATMLDTQWGFAGTWTAGIDSTNRFYIELTRAGVTSCSLIPGASDPWGWGGVIVGVNTSGDIWRFTATSPWTKGNFSAGTTTKFLVGVDGDTMSFPDYNMIHQSVPSWLTASASSYVDPVAESLSNWDNDANDPTNRRYTWGIDSEGRTFTSWDAALGAPYTPTWISTTFRDALGFTGSESAVSANGIYSITSTYPARGVLILRNGLAVLNPSMKNIGSAVSQVNGRIAARNVATYQEIQVSTTLRGGVGLSESRSAYEDESEIYRHRVFPYLFRGARCTLIPDFADPRLGLSRIHQVQLGVAAATPYSTYVNATTGGVMGRYRCEVSVDSPPDSMLSFASNTPRIRTAPLNWILRLLD